MKRWLFVFLLMSIVMPASALAEEGKQTKPHIKPDQGDLDTVGGKKTLIISGWLGEDNVFGKSLRLTAVGGDVEEFIFLPSDLDLTSQKSTK